MSELEPNAGTGGEGTSATETETTAAESEDTIFSPIGLRDVVVAKLLTDPKGGTPTYDTVVPLVGAIDFDFQDNSGDPDVQDYDDGEHDVVMPEPKTTGTLELADLPPASLAMLEGHRIDDNGVVVRNSEDKPPYFAWGFKSVKSNGEDRYTWYYKGRASRESTKYTTKKRKEVARQTSKLKVTFVKLNSTGNDKVYVDENTEAFASAKATFFTAPYMPTFTE